MILGILDLTPALGLHLLGLGLESGVDLLLGQIPVLLVHQTSFGEGKPSVLEDQVDHVVAGDVP